MPKCSCRRIAPRCLYCLEDKRRRNKAAYTTADRREKARRARAKVTKDYRGMYRDIADIKQAELILSRKPPSSAITWLELSAGRSNS